MPEIIVPPEEDGMRADVVLSQHIATSRSRIQKCIKTGEITLNGHSFIAHDTVQENDVLLYPATLTDPPPPKTGSAPTLNIVFQNDDLLVLEKPAGLLVHQATEYGTEQTLVDGLIEAFPAIKTVGDDPIRPGIVHRLDRDVSGLMVVAKTQEMFENLKSQFQERTTQKIYLALAYGVIPADADDIRLRIARSKSRGRMVARPESQEGKEAVTKYEVLDRFKIATYVRVQILTGRTHQIRAHFKAIDHPLVGDKLYAKKSMKHIRPIELDRIFLHAHELTIRLLDGEEKTFTSELPSDLQTVLENLPKE
jgi:23S rRNA pseudouridine1911/1915/1917 synthase